MNDQKLKVLYVDDEDTNLFIFNELLKYKFTITIASMPIDALSILDCEQIDVVVSDMKMPQMNGVEMIRQAKKKHDSIPYFMLTAFDDNEEINQALDEGLIVNCFIKPLNVEKITEEILQAVK